jgi:hypothetical protein
MLIVAQLVKKFSIFYTKQEVHCIALTAIIVSYPEKVYMVHTFQHPVYLRPISILSSHFFPCPV